MDVIETKVFREPWAVDRRLKELGLNRAGLLAVRDVALHESSNATAFHPANAAGTLAYQHGTWSLRDQFVSDEWADDRAGGVETIRNDTLKLRVAFSNVDLACNDSHNPKPRSNKGAGAERVSGVVDLFRDLPSYAPRPSSEWALFYLMVDENGYAELTRPVVKNGTFVAAIERIYLWTGDDDDDGFSVTDDGVADNFDPQITRKQ